MKSLIIYYSLSGGCMRVAECLHKYTDADILRLEPVKDIPKKGLFSIIRGVFQIMRKKMPELKPYSIKPDEYDLIILGTPVWANTYTPAFNTFLKDNHIQNKKIAMFCTCMGTKGGVFNALKEKLSGNIFAGETEFIRPLEINQKELDSKIKTWTDTFYAANVSTIRHFP